MVLKLVNVLVWILLLVMWSVDLIVNFKDVQFPWIALFMVVMSCVNIGLNVHSRVLTKRRR